jgi:tryptophan-rich sensory protein
MLMRREKSDLLTLGAALAIPQIVGGLGAVATVSSVSTWYKKLRKPSWTPPSWVFGPAWTTLYLLMGLASWLVLRRKQEDDEPVTTEAALYGTQLGLNLLWSILFFGLRRVDLALAEIAALWAAILATLVRFARARPASGLLLVPYLAWTTFAAALNAAVWRLNRQSAPTPGPRPPQS